ncbi:hypothetical protein EV191_110208 [Tamaricihabitans halophyticus]|uniref:Uncharacterized protein n=1 Tax=Tamaricihabitans halophyticus TaxID=1262583 RepID=A0A4R2QHJ9_9PSEU|nr:hypothetical protein [Tamaricihabitans halophyticus]TCP48647.1 hypothetical protein EV191_110208 [Tamaricihabitans halophyticus]
MPIRTSRGRAAVYRRLWGWPLRSPAHLVGMVVLVLALITAIGILVPRLVGGDSTGPGAGDPNQPAYVYSSPEDSASGSGQPAGSGSPQPTRLTGPLETPQKAPPNPKALQTAKNWADAWVQHRDGMTNREWLDGLRPYTTQEYLPVMSSVDPRNLPANRITGEPEAVESYTSSAEVDVPTDGPVLRISVVQTGQGWRVAGYEEGS